MNSSYPFPVYHVETCPTTNQSWYEASQSLNCSLAQNNISTYHCVPNEQKTYLVEFCYRNVGLKESGNCLYLSSDGYLNQDNCSAFIEGCPSEHYFSNDIYKYPKCLEIDTGERGFVADPECTSRTTTVTNTTTVDLSTSTQPNGSFLLAGTFVGIGIVLFLVGISLRYFAYQRRRSGVKRKDNICEEEKGPLPKDMEICEDQSNLKDEVPGPSASKLNIPREKAVVEAAATDFRLSSEHKIVRRDVHIPDDDKMLSKEIKVKKGTNKHGITNKPFTLAENFMFNRTLDHRKETGEDDIRMKDLVNFLDLEENPNMLSRCQMINTDYREIISHLDYLDCVGVDFGMTKKPFIQCIQPFQGDRGKFDDFVEWINVCENVLRETRSTQWSSISSVVFAVYAKEAISGFTPSKLKRIIDYSMRCAMENENHILVFEIVNTYLFDCVIELQSILQDTKGISTAITKTILQASRKMIIKKSPNLKSNTIGLSFCWDCKQGNCVVVFMSYTGNVDITDRIPSEIMGLKLVLYNFTQPSDEASRVFKSTPVSKKTQLPTVTECEARELFRKHSNLTMISASPYKSMGYSIGKHRLVEKPCINLFCFHKWYIPYGETEFPKKIRDVEVDVHEGYCYFGAGRSLELGGYIRRLGCGSIGGFVDLPNDKVGLITCAHVVFSPEELICGQLPGTSIVVEAFDKKNHTYNECGECIRANFPPCDQIEVFNPESASSDPNVDAALIELDQSIDTFEFRAVTSEQLKSAGFDPINPPVFSGEVVFLPDPDPVHRVSGRIPNKLDSVVKYGAESGFTIGNLYFNRVHVRFVREKLDLPGNSHCAIMCDQIEIQSLPQGQFFECGDSGSFVFCINPDKTLSCLGMAVGISPRKSCLVTPIDRILRSVCPPGTQLKPCSSFIEQTNAPPQATLDMILTAIGHIQTSIQNDKTNFHTSLQNVETNFQTSLQNVERNVNEGVKNSLQSVRADFQTSLQNVETNFQTSLQNVERNLERNFQSSLKNTETNFKASFQNIQTDVRTLQRHAQQTDDSKTQSSLNQSESSANQNVQT